MIEISVVLPTYNRKESLRECLDSLFLQDFPREAYEVIVVDDGSTDGTGGIIKAGFPCRGVNLIYVRQDHKGVSAASNLGIRYSQGRIIGFTEDDCVVPSDWIRKIVYFHHRYEDLAIQGRITNCYQDNLIAILEQTLNDAYLPYVLDEVNGNRYITLFSSGNSSFKMEIFQNYGVRFNENLVICEDVDLSNQLIAKGLRILYIEEIAVKHKHRVNISSFVKKHFFDGRWQYLLRRFWHKDKRDYNTKKFSQVQFFLKLSFANLKDYKTKGIILILLHIARKSIRTSGYVFQKLVYK